eukprot:1142810-Pelagomonas_calceolata.AAC.4
MAGWHTSCFACWYAQPPGIPYLPDAALVQFGKFERMGFTRPEIVTLMAAGHTVANGLEGAAFDLTPAVFDLGWFGVSRTSFCKKQHTRNTQGR